MSDDPRAPVIPGWTPLPYGFHTLPDGPVLTWFPHRDWDGEPWYYVPDELSVPAPAAVDPARALALQAATDNPGMDLEPRELAVARAQAYYAFLTTP